jgi:hypothetical protein
MPAIAPSPALPSAAVVGRPIDPRRDDASSSPHDSRRLNALLLVFVATSVVVVGALWAAVAIGTWWALVLVIAVHFVTTAIVFGAVSFVLSGHRPGRGG